MKAGPASGAGSPPPFTGTPPIEIPFPDLSRWAAGNSGVPFVWTFSAREPGPHVVVQSLTHGNEVCGAIAVDRLLDEGLRPARGTVSFVFANVGAYRSFDRADPFASRCLDEDFNRVWSAEVLGGTRQTRDLARARELRPVIDRADALLDLHSMTDPCPPLALAGTRDKGLALARAVGVPPWIIIDAGHAAGKRLRDYAFFDDPADPRLSLLFDPQTCGGLLAAVPEAAAAGLVQAIVAGGLADAAVIGRVAAGPPELEVTAHTAAASRPASASSASGASESAASVVTGAP